MTETRKAPGDQSGGPSKMVGTTSHILARQGDGFRARRLRHIARRQLDELVGVADPWTMSEPIDWHAAHMDLDVVERDALGRSLAAVSR